VTAVPLAAATALQLITADQIRQYHYPAYVQARLAWGADRPEVPHQELPGPADPLLFSGVAASGTAVMHHGPVPLRWWPVIW
jgi:hypothetical protein